MRLYLGNLSFQYDERTLERELSNRGVIVLNVKIIRDKETQMPRGFGFAEVDDSTADTALGLSGTIIGGRAIKIDRANEQERRPRGGGSYGGSGSGSGSGSGGRREEFADDWPDDRRRRR
jgi:RNA recognition motif-containing protein